MAETRYGLILDHNHECFPTISVRLLKGPQTKFKYAVVLSIIERDKRVEIITIDNHHIKGNHIHKKYKKGKTREEQFDFKSIEGCIDHLSKNWPQKIESYRKG